MAQLGLIKCVKQNSEIHKSENKTTAEKNEYPLVLQMNLPLWRQFDKIQIFDWLWFLPWTVF